MANLRDLKRDLNHLIIDVIEEAYNVQLSDPSKTEQTEKFIDDTIDYHMNVITRINQAKSKKEIQPIKS
jgi:hypothetical protein